MVSDSWYWHPAFQIIDVLARVSIYRNCTSCQTTARILDCIDKGCVSQSLFVLLFPVRCWQENSVMKKALQHFHQKVNPFKGQKGQDKWVIFNALPFKRNGYFLDLAAADGVLHNNTYALEKIFNWTGLCIEPNPEFYENLQSVRSCIAVQAVVSNKPEQVKFRIDNGQLGGIVAEDTDNSSRVRGEQIRNARTITLDAVLLGDLLEQYNAPQTIDYFSLDVEGSEERVISSLDFEKYRFRCLTIERPTPEVNRILFENEYVFVKNYRYDSFYIHSSLAEQRTFRCQPFEQVPAKDW